VRTEAAIHILIRLPDTGEKESNMEAQKKNPEKTENIVDLGCEELKQVSGGSFLGIVCPKCGSDEIGLYQNNEPGHECSYISKRLPGKADR
jgi:hypothetical protein